jgi:hypothetical protein
VIEPAKRGVLLILKENGRVKPDKIGFLLVREADPVRWMN